MSGAAIVHNCFPPVIVGLTVPAQPDWTCGTCGRVWRDMRSGPIQALIEQGATEGERAAARAALDRIDAVAAERTAELERLVGFGYRGPAPSEDAHARTERGSYYARDTLAGSTDE